MRKHGKENSFPAEEVLYNLVDSGDTHNAIMEVLEPLPAFFEKDPADYSDGERQFVYMTLPTAFRLFSYQIKKPKAGSKAGKALSEFNGNYIQLLSILDLDEQLLEPLNENLGEIRTSRMNIFKPEMLSKEEEDEILAFKPDSEVIRETDFKIHVIHLDLVKQCFTRGFFKKVVEKLSCNCSGHGAISEHQLGLTLKLFRSMQHLVQEQIVTVLLPLLASEAVKMLMEKTTDNEGMCSFLSDFCEMLPDVEIPGIIRLLCNFMASDKNIRFKSDVTKYLRNIVSKVKLGEKEIQLVKNTFMDAAGSQNNPEYLEQVANFLPVLSSKVMFVEKDLCRILDMAHLPISNKVNVITKIIGSVGKTNLDEFGSHLLSSEIFSPAIYCFAIERTTWQIAQSLFSRLIKVPPGELRRALSTIEGLDRKKLMGFIREALQETDVHDIERFYVLSVFFTADEQNGDMNDFIEMMIEKAETNIECLKILHQFSKSMGTGNSEKIIQVLFDATFNHYMNGDAPEFVERSVVVLTHWIKNAKKIVEEKIYNTLLNIDFADIPNEIPKLVSTIIEKTKDASRKRKLLMKIVQDTVSEKFSHWAIQLVFSQLHDNEKYVKEIADILFGHLAGPKVRNAVFMIQKCVQYEADFFKIGEQYGMTFKIFIDGARHYELDCSLHPYHTCRRIYAEAQNKMNMAIDKFELRYQHSEVERGLLSSTPLSIIVEDLDPLYLSYLTIQSEIRDFGVSPTFMTYLDEDLGKLEALYGLLTVAENDVPDIIIDILKLFSLKIGELSEPVCPLQWIVRGNYEYPLEFADNPRLFSWALDAYPHETMSAESFEKVLESSTNGGYEQLNIIMMSKKIFDIKVEGFLFSEDMVRKCLIENPNECLRTSIQSHFTKENDISMLFHLMDLVLEKKYRSRSEEFLKCFELYVDTDESRDIFIRYFKELDPYENLGEIDQTFISFLKLIPKTPESVKLVYNRLSNAPTVKSPNNPFIHSEPAREAAFQFLKTKHIFEYLLGHMNSLPAVPSANQRFSDDFIPKGRNGISNLGSTCYINALMQALNTLNAVNVVLGLPTEDLRSSPFLLELRNFLAELRYSRGTSMSIQSLVDQIPNFDAFIQEDAEEFLNNLINRILTELKDPQLKDPVKAELEGKVESTIENDEEVFRARTEDFYTISLPTKDLSSLIDSYRKYFDDEKVEGYSPDGREGKVDAFMRKKIMRWPKSLIIQLQRWDYSLTTGERIKLVHEFSFPTILTARELSEGTHNAPCEFDYTLSAIVVHKGTPESGHYIAIVDGDNGEWYLCDDDFEIRPFDIANVCEYFGVADSMDISREQVPTGYLLFYRQAGRTNEHAVLPADLEDRINRTNEATWPMTFFYAESFVKFASDLITMYPGDYALDVAFRTFFKIVVANETLMHKWEKLMLREILTTQENCSKFFDYIEELGSSFGMIISLSDFAMESIQNVVFAAFRQLTRTSKPVMTILEGINLYDHRRAISFAFDMIQVACNDLDVDWAEEEVLLLTMVQYVVADISKELLRNLRKQHIDAIEGHLSKLSYVVVQKGVIEAIEMWFNPDILTNLYPILKKSDNFETLVSRAISLQPSLLSRFNDSSKEVSQLLGGVATLKSASESAALLSFDPSFMESVIPSTVFSENDMIRKSMTQMLENVLPQPDPIIKKYLDSVDRKNIQLPVPDETSFTDLLLGLVPCGLENIDYFYEFSNVLLRLSYCAPFGTSILLPDIVETIPRVESPELLSKFLSIVKNILVYDESLIPLVTEQALRSLFDLEHERVCESIQLISMFPTAAANSVLLSSSIIGCLAGRFDAFTEKLIDMLNEGLAIGHFEVPVEPKDPMNIKLAVVLFKKSEQKESLVEYMLSIFSKLSPCTIFADSPIFAEAAQILNEVCPEKFAAMMKL